MKCEAPRCNCTVSRVMETRKVMRLGKEQTMRRRQCRDCAITWRTYEVPEFVGPDPESVKAIPKKKAKAKRKRRSKKKVSRK